MSYFWCIASLKAEMVLQGLHEGIVACHEGTLSIVTNTLIT